MISELSLFYHKTSQIATVSPKKEEKATLQSKNRRVLEQKCVQSHSDLFLQRNPKCPARRATECDANQTKIKLLFRPRREQSKAHRRGKATAYLPYDEPQAPRSNDGMRRESGEKVSWQDPIVRSLVPRNVAGTRK